MEQWLAAHLLWTPWPQSLALVLWALIKIICVLVPLLLGVAYLTLAERKVIGFMQVRIGPNRVGFWGLLQPIADGMKLMFKEIVVPSTADRFLFYSAPVLAMTPALMAWAVIPFTGTVWVTQINAALLYVLAVTSLGVYGIILAGWSSNSKYALMGAMRSTAQIVSYEIAMGFALVGVMVVANSLNFIDIVHSQQRGWFAEHGWSILSWNWLPLLPIFVVYLISAVAETNRAPFDVAEGESEIVAGFHVEYSGIAFAIFFLAEYANMILVSALTALMFLGGWLSPFGFLPDGVWWLLIKIVFLLYGFLWIRATFPRFRYDQIMRLGWKVFIPVTLLWLVVISIWRLSPWNIWL